PPPPHPGQVRKAGGPGPAFIGGGVYVDNDGVLEATSGTVSLSGGDGGNVETGTFSGSAPGSLVSFDSGDYSLGSGAGFAGRVALTDATLDVVGAVSAAAGSSVAQSGGVLGGAGTMTLGGSFEWSGGTQSDAGVTRVLAA